MNLFFTYLITDNFNIYDRPTGYRKIYGIDGFVHHSIDIQNFETGQTIANQYAEVVRWTDIYERAKTRNKIFFAKINIPIELHKISIRELVKDYVNSDEEGVKGYGGKLDIRPKYQREFVYKDEQRNAVINTVRNGFLLNVMYWVKNNEQSFEVLDGQQRTISICEYIKNNFSIEYKLFSNLTNDEQEQILNYELMIYFL